MARNSSPYFLLSLRAIAAEFTRRGIRTRRGGRWGVGNVKAVVGRVRLGVRDVD